MKISAGDMPNVLFLDVDGVLNSEVWFRKRIKSHSDEDDTVDQHMLSMLDPDAVEIVSDFVEQTKCKVVLSSTWRQSTSLEKMNEYLKKKGATFEVTAMTPRFQQSNVFRGNEIYAWLNAHISNHRDFNRYVIFDDDSDMLLWQKNNFFRVDRHCGITPNVCYRAKLYLESVK